MAAAPASRRRTWKAVLARNLSGALTSGLLLASGTLAAPLPPLRIVYAPGCAQRTPGHAAAARPGAVPALPRPGKAGQQ